MKKLFLVVLSLFLLGHLLMIMPGMNRYEQPEQSHSPKAQQQQSSTGISQLEYIHFLASSKTESLIHYSGNNFQVSLFEKSFRKYSSLLRQIEPIMTTNIFRYVIRNYSYRINNQRFTALYPFHEFL
jgi:hypothetical protein